MTIRDHLTALGHRVSLTTRSLWRQAGATHQRLGRWAWPTWAASAVALVVVINLLFVVPGPGGIRSAADMPVATLVYDMRDRQVFSIYREQRTPVTLSDISPHVIRAALAVEDERFYDHSGVDIRRIFGAAIANVKRGELAQGGSTITQQLARKTFLTDEKSFWRKAREMVLAIKLEWAFSKDEILEMYLNRIYFGRGFYGIEAASQGYFGKKSAALTLDESALLVGLIQAPSAYAPPTHLDRALARREIVLSRMKTVGAISENEAKAAAKAKVKLRPGLTQPRFGDYFRNRVTQQLIATFGEEMVWNGGLRVYTTIDPAAQRAAERALVAGLDAIETRRGYDAPKMDDKAAMVDGQPAYLQGALVSIDPRNGHVRALVGGRDFGDSMYDRAVDARRQAGSAYKPLVFAAALESGASPATLITDLDATTRISGGVWRPENAHEINADSITMREAMRTSNNRAAVRVLTTVGIPTASAYAERLGLAAPPPVPSLVLGSGEVSLLSLTTAYGAFANGGLVHPPLFIRKVEDADGNLLWHDTSESHRAVSPSTAFLMADMLADVIDRGTGTRARSEGFLLPAGGKTGTTDDYKDAWFVGFTPTLVTGVWSGFDQPRQIAPNGYATGLVVPIWARFMRDVTRSQPARWLDPPSDIVVRQVCLRTGYLPTPGCQMAFIDTEEDAPRDGVGLEFFREGTEPEQFCPLHGNRSLFRRLDLRGRICRVIGCQGQ
jgi:1A family penicillin-binding protein